MIRYVIIFILRLYQYLVSPLFVGLGGRCRFYPSCSAYALQAVRYHGVVKGLMLAIIRLSHCHPLSKRCGIDPVPLNESSGESMSKADIDVSL